jgi:hypothetical protein
MAELLLFSNADINAGRNDGERPCILRRGRAERMLPRFAGRQGQRECKGQRRVDAVEIRRRLREPE